jgi:FdhD protein
MSANDRRRVLQWRDAWRAGPDAIAIEEPVEIEVDGAVVSTTMRTPGNDTELALGWLVSEGAITSADSVVEVRECFESAEGEELDAGAVAGAYDPGDDVRRIVKVRTTAGVGVAPRLHATSSACGVCGTDVIAATLSRRPWDVSSDHCSVAPDLLAQLPGLLRTAQRGFDSSGGLHAAGLFTIDGELVCLREDVGRHNAVDKVVGWALARGALPLRAHVLQVSGRASAELVHKALMAGIPVLSAVSAPTTLAVDLARAGGLTLAGFVRDATLNVYAGGGRLGAPD